jgi:hypothetical protein
MPSKNHKYTIRDKIHNATIRENVGIKPCMQYIEKQRIKWSGHLVRMQSDKSASRALHFRSSGYRTQGRPRKRWLDGVSEICKNNNTTVSQTVQYTLLRHSIPRRFTAQSEHVLKKKKNPILSVSNLSLYKSMSIYV